MFRKSLLFGAVVLLVGSVAVADQCSDVLVEQVLRKTLSRDETLAALSFINERNYENLKKRAGGSVGLSLKFIGIELGGQYQDFVSKSSEKLATFQRAHNISERMSLVRRGLSPAQIKAWSDCQNSKALRLSAHSEDSTGLILLVEYVGSQDHVAELTIRVEGQSRIKDDSDGQLKKEIKLSIRGGGPKAERRVTREGVDNTIRIRASGAGMSADLVSVGYEKLCPELLDAEKLLQEHHPGKKIIGAGGIFEGYNTSYKDLNKDGYCDITFYHVPGTAFYKGRGDGTVDAVIRWTPPEGPEAYATFRSSLVDYNNDKKGWLDLVFTREDYKLVFGYAGQGDGTFKQPRDEWSAPGNETP